VDFEVTGEGPAQSLHFTTLTGDKMTAGPDNPIRVSRDADSDEPAPYIRVRRNLDALIDRKSFYRLVDLGVQGEYDGAEWFGLWSGGVFFPMIPSGELPG